MEMIKHLYEKFLGQPLELILAEVWLSIIILIAAIINIKGFLIISSVILTCASIIIIVRYLNGDFKD